MRLLAFFALAIHLLTAAAQPQIIFDTDFGGDADDLGALAMLHNFVNRGECDLLAVMCWNVEPDAVSAIDAVNTYYGNPDIPIGARKDPAEPVPWNHTQVLASQFPHDVTKSSVPESTELYRQILANSDSQEVMIVTVGPLSNIKRLLDSEPDAISSLTGEELISQKVKEFVIMGGQFPSGQKEWNFDGNMPGVTEYVIDALNVPITFSGYEVGVDMKTGEVFNELAADHPLRLGFLHFSEFCPWLNHQWAGNIYDNSTYDQTAVLYAVRGGIDTYWERVEGGYCLPDAIGGNTWAEGGNKEHSYLKLLWSVEEMATLIEDLMTNNF